MRAIDADALRERLLVLRSNVTNVSIIDIFDICLSEVSNAPTINMAEQNEYKSCKGCKYYSYGCFNGFPCVNCRRNFKLVDEIREQKNDLWKDGTPNG